MVILHCNPVDYRKCKDCQNRECEESGLDEELQEYRRLNSDKTWRYCALCGHCRRLYLFDESEAHPGMKYFCELRQRYLRSGDGACGWYCG